MYNFSIRIGLIVIVCFAMCASSCSLFEVKGKGHMKVQYGDKVIEKDVEFENLEEMPAAMKELGGALRESTDMLIEALVEAPPPGDVKLGDIVPGLAAYEANDKINFLLAAKNAKEPIFFKYVQLGVPSYDNFFRAAAQFHALAYQTKQTSFSIKRNVATIMGTAQLPQVNLRQEVDRAMATGMNPGTVQAKNDLHMVASVAASVATSARAMVQKVQQLVASGQQLVVAAPSSITNPKTAIHLNLILKGLKESVAMVGQSGQLMGQAIPELAGF